jgi:hypothetical protein
VRIYAYALSAAVIAATAYPALLDPSEDSFPLSTYPMFSRPKPRTTSVTAAVAVGSGGFERPIPPGYVANSEAMQALQTIRKSVRAGRESARELCRAIAGRIVAAGDDDFRPAAEVVLVTTRVDSIKYLGGDRTPIGRRVHARCELPWSAP